MHIDWPCCQGHYFTELVCCFVREAYAYLLVDTCAVWQVNRVVVEILTKCQEIRKSLPWYDVMVYCCVARAITVTRNQLPLLMEPCLSQFLSVRCLSWWEAMAKSWEPGVFYHRYCYVCYSWYLMWNTAGCSKIMMTSSNENILRYWPFVQGIHRSRWSSRTKASDAKLFVFFDLRLNKRLRKQS